MSTKKEVATTEKNNGMIIQNEELVDLYSQGDNLGSQDLTIPFLKILQKLSPECDKDNVEFIPEAEPGMIMNTATKQLYKPEEGVQVVIATVRRELTEWAPRESDKGMIANHGTDLSPLRNEQNTRNERGQVFTKDGNMLVEAMQYYVMVVDPETGMFDPAIISMASTNMKPAKDLNLMIKTAKFKTPDGRLINNVSSFVYVYSMKTQKRSNNQGTWYVFKPERICLTDQLPDGINTLKAANEFKKAVLGGTVKGDHESVGSDNSVDDADIPI